MKFKYTIFYVECVEKTLAFYCEAFGFQQLFLHESGDYGELDTGSTTLAFSSFELMENLGKKPHQANSDHPVFEIAFETDDVAAGVIKAQAAGAALVQQPTDMPWGQTVAYVTDMNGYLIELCTAVNK